ncbi:MAG: hypothetical protein HPY66_2373 [Firmicutes bacterium]|nr:hypothetical protein [Bacillota bacterium]MDI6705759.1 interleukin-like EMT inducer domain-containing protein [Bacillota bacterium]
MKRGYIFVLLILFAAVAYFYSPVHRESIGYAQLWWTRWYAVSQTNLLPDERGLNVAVLDADGMIVEARSFDTCVNADSGFAEYIKALPIDSWVVIAAKDDAATSLSSDDLLALKYLGGSDELEGKYTWAYILVGRPNLGEGNGLEWLDELKLNVKLTKKDIVGDLPLPTGMHIYSFGYYTGTNGYWGYESYKFAGLNIETEEHKNLKYWIKTAIERI